MKLRTAFLCIAWYVVASIGTSTVHGHFYSPASVATDAHTDGIEATPSSSLPWSPIQPAAAQETPYIPQDARLPTTPAHFFLPGTQPEELNSRIPDPQQCNLCHTDPIYASWRGSMMANAGRDPLFWAALAVANADAEFAGEFCIRCHFPKGWLEGRSQPTDGSTLTSTDIDAGVACEVCHRMVDPVPSTSADDEARLLDATIRANLTTELPMTIGSGTFIIDPSDNRRGPFALSSIPHSAYQSDYLGQSSDATTRSRLCGTCHNIDNPALIWTENPPDGAPAQFWLKSVEAQGAMDVATVTEAMGTEADFFPIESTYDEWLNSDYPQGVYAPRFAGAKADGIVAACQDCHMPRSTGKAADIGSAVQRDCQTTGCLPVHTLVGGNTWVPQLLQNEQWRLHASDEAEALDAATVASRQLLRQAASMTATLTISGSQQIAVIRIYNQSGHKLPTGYAEGRRMWINLRAYDAQGTIIYESGAYDANTGILTEDDALKVYEVKQGLTPALANLVGLEAGPSFHFVLNNTIFKDNRIPPRGYTVAGFDQPGLRPIGTSFTDGQFWDDTIYNVPAKTAFVQGTLYYQTASKAYIDFLRAEGGSDGETLGQLWDQSKSPPELMTLAVAPDHIQYLPFLQRSE